jgi:hypothetical protein
LKAESKHVLPVKSDELARGVLPDAHARVHESLKDTENPGRLSTGEPVEVADHHHIERA